MAGYVRGGERVVDVGSDHAMLPLYLVENGVSPCAILTDRVPGPLKKAYGQVSRVVDEEDRPQGFPCRLGSYEFRLGNGLGAVKTGEADVAVIAGMGGETIAGILAREPEIAAGFSRLILQPRTKGAALRAYLTESGFEILADTVAGEKGRMCEIVVTRSI
jgi:tRNA (adenine22-N1)-methyltransferase